MSLVAGLIVLAWPIVLRRAAAGRVQGRVNTGMGSGRWRPRFPARSRSRVRDLADSVDRLASALASGMSMGTAFETAAACAPGELRRELTEVASEFAREPARALERWRSTKPHEPGVALVVGALSLGHATGGDRARAAAVAASTLRERADLEAEVRVQAAQAKVSAAIVAATPIAFVSFAAVTDHRTARFLGSPAGLIVGAIALALDGSGAWWMMRLTRRVAQWS